jgi:hypothetical protein
MEIINISLVKLVKKIVLLDYVVKKLVFRHRNISQRRA